MVERDPIYFPLLDDPIPPGVRNLQSWIEQAWHEGKYDSREWPVLSEADFLCLQALIWKAQSSFEISLLVLQSGLEQQVWHILHWDRLSDDWYIIQSFMLPSHIEVFREHSEYPFIV